MIASPTITTNPKDNDCGAAETAVREAIVATCWLVQKLSIALVLIQGRA
jgi:hypothetical protein